MSQCNAEMQALEMKVSQILESNFSPQKSEMQVSQYSPKRYPRNVEQSHKSTNSEIEESEIKIEKFENLENFEEEESCVERSNMDPVTDINLESSESNLSLESNNMKRAFESKDSLFVATGSIENFLSRSDSIDKEVPVMKYTVPKCFSSSDDDFTPESLCSKENENEKIEEENHFTQFSSDFEEEEKAEQNKQENSASIDQENNCNEAEEEEKVEQNKQEEIDNEISHSNKQMKEEVNKRIDSNNSQEEIDQKENNSKDSSSSSEENSLENAKVDEEQAEKNAQVNEEDEDEEENVNSDIYRSDDNEEEEEKGDDKGSDVAFPFEESESESEDNMPRSHSDIVIDQIIHN